MKTEKACPSCHRQVGRRSLPNTDLGNKVLRLFGKDAKRAEVSVCQSCEAPARIRTAKCVWCWDEFAYYATDWKSRKRRWCSSCERKRNAWNVDKHRAAREFRDNPWSAERTERELAEMKRMILSLPLDEQEKLFAAFEDGTIDHLFPRPKKP